MQNFIVLGIIPGTNYQTTLSFWIGVAFGLLGLLSIPQIIQAAKRLRRYWAMRKIAHTINHFELVTQ